MRQLTSIRRLARWVMRVSRDSRAAHGRDGKFRPQLEVLEGRTLPATVTWIGSTGDWAVAGNWDGGALPGAADDVLIPDNILSPAEEGEIPLVITHSAGASPIRSLNTFATVLSPDDPPCACPFRRTELVISGGSLAIADVSLITASLTVSGGELRIAGRLTVHNAYTQTDGATILAGGVLVLAQRLDVQGGVLRGTGTIIGDVHNAGRLYVGGTGVAGTMTIEGNYTQAAGGVLEIEVGGAAAGAQHDQLSVTGAANLDGTLSVRLLDGFFPSEGDAFSVLTFASRVGDFATIEGLDLGRGLAFSPICSDDSLALLTVLA